MTNTIDLNTTALVLIEMQNDFLSLKGKMNGLVQDVIEVTKMKENANAAIAAARNSGIPVLFVPLTFSEGHLEMGTDPYGILKIVKDQNALLRGSWGAEVYDGIDVQEDDIIIEGKTSISAFPRTNLDAVLQDRGIKTIVLGGFLSNICVNATMTAAYDKGYNVITLTDAVATAGKDAQDKIIEHVYPMFSTPMETKIFVSTVKFG